MPTVNLVKTYLRKEALKVVCFSYIGVMALHVVALIAFVMLPLQSVFLDYAIFNLTVNALLVVAALIYWLRTRAVIRQTLRVVALSLVTIVLRRKRSQHN